MRLALFFVINVLAAVAFGFIAASHGYGAGGIALVVIGVLAALQLAYVLWLVAISRLPDAPDGSEEAASSAPYLPSTGRRLSGAKRVSGNELR